MTKVTIDRALIEQALMLADAVNRPNSRVSWNPTGGQLNALRDALRAALAELVVKDCLTTEPLITTGAMSGMVDAQVQDIWPTKSALAEPAVEPVGWEWRWFDANPNTVTFGQWSEWKRVEPRNRLCTVEDSLNEFRAYIANGHRYELRALYTSPPPAEPEGIVCARCGGLVFDPVCSPAQPAVEPLLSDEEIHDTYDELARSAPYLGAVTRCTVARAIEQLVRRKAGL